MKTLQASTFALMGNDASDATYTSCEAKINQWVQTRNSLAQQMKALLDGAAFGGQPVSASDATALIYPA
jgi:hypothetical protein